jgi:hypothetical protein
MPVRKHWLTTLFGFLLALATASTNAPGLRDNPTIRDIGGIVGTVAALALGAAAADANKSNGYSKEK